MSQPPSRFRRPRNSLIIELAVVTVASLVVVHQLDPAAVLRDSVPWRTDLSGHIVVPWVDRQDWSLVLPGSWSDAWFGGFPINQLYPALPSFLAAVLSLTMPLAVAFKIVVVAPLVLLPPAAYVSARWAGFGGTLSAVVAVATLPYLFDTSCVTCGGNIASTVNGEFAFAWSMLFGVLALGAVDRLARTGAGVATTAVLVTLTAWSHPLPPVWLAVGVAVVLVGRRVWTDPRILRNVGISAASAVLLSSVWWLPFLTRRDWMPVLGFARADDYAFWLLPASIWWEALVLAAVVAGVAFAVARRSWWLVAFAVTGAASLLAFLLIGADGQLYNLRVLPFWYLGRWVLAAVGAAWLASWLLARSPRARTAVRPWAPAVALTAVLAVIGTTWGWWAVTTPPGDGEDGVAAVAGLSVPVTRQAWAPSVVLGGFAARDDYDELVTVQQMLQQVAAGRGCGRLMWDQGAADERGAPFGDSAVFSQVAMWTDGCVTSLMGELLDSSATVPAIAMTASLVSNGSEYVIPSVPTFAYDLSAGVTRMRTLGARYYLTHGGTPASDAASNAELAQVAKAGRWQVWEIGSGAAAGSLLSNPSVVTPEISTGDWDNLATAYFPAPSYDAIPLAQQGPATWPRVPLSQIPQTSAVEAAEVSDVREEGNTLTFDVKRTGVPVVVRASAFPGWSVSGADGPYRATPNFMVVVPTETTVTMTKDRTTVDYAALLLGALGAGLLVAAAVRDRLQRCTDPRDVGAGASAPDTAEV